jgi:ADP-ribose pyrophosphatase YjhB (NUDIX family)
MQRLTFNNKPNEMVFLSRSVAVMAVILVRVGGVLWVPLGKRSDKVSNPGEWCLPCGYIDWNESGQEAIVRESYEELGLDLRGLIPEQPWFVQSQPNKDPRQNITLRFGCVYDVLTLPELSIDNVEVISAEWRTVWDAINSSDLCFNHGSIIEEFIAYIE